VGAERDREEGVFGLIDSAYSTVQLYHPDSMTRGLMKLSIAIPAYEMSGRGADFLNFSCRKLSDQHYRNFEVVVSDHSRDRQVADVCSAWRGNGLDIIHIGYDAQRGNSSANLNNALRHCSGDWIKILFQDDFLYSSDSLRITAAALGGAHQEDWLVSACEHTRDGETMLRQFYPKYHDDIHLGDNTISSPSVLTIRNKDIIYFDEALVWLMDVDYYKRLFMRSGHPFILNDITVVNRLWQGQQTHMISDAIKERERRLARLKYR
jgi:hypothetical protein